MGKPVFNHSRAGLVPIQGTLRDRMPTWSDGSEAGCSIWGVQETPLPTTLRPHLLVIGSPNFSASSISMASFRNVLPRNFVIVHIHM